MSSPWSFAERLVRGARKEESPHELRAFFIYQQVRSEPTARVRQGGDVATRWAVLLIGMTGYVTGSLGTSKAGYARKERLFNRTV